MRIVFKKNISCDNSLKCSVNFSDKLEELFPKLRRGINYHVTIDHLQFSHKIWFFVYDSNGKHEGEHNGKIIITEDENIKKYSGSMPTESEIKKLI